MLFDAEPVEACLVQPGVLRCRCPAHAPGIASLQVACDGFVVSDSVAFEYRRAPTTEPSPERALLDRLADVESRLQGPGPPSPAAHLEERLVAYCQVSGSSNSQPLPISLCPNDVRFVSERPRMLLSVRGEPERNRYNPAALLSYIWPQDWATPG